MLFAKGHGNAVSLFCCKNSSWFAAERIHCREICVSRELWQRGNTDGLTSQARHR